VKERRSGVRVEYIISATPKQYSVLRAGKGPFRVLKKESWRDAYHGRRSSSGWKVYGKGKPGLSLAEVVEAFLRAGYTVKVNHTSETFSPDGVNIRQAGDHGEA
jgi:hypothetical protein